MTAPDHEPTQDELMAMAYADGELAVDQSAAFEARLPAEPDLARQVAHYKALELLARQMAPPEPSDHEWARLEADPLQQAGSQMGWALFCAGALGLTAFGLWGLLTTDDMGPMPKACILALILGLGSLLAVTIRGRLALLPFDPYRKVKR
jgi:anti-sigma factor RsiW